MLNEWLLGLTAISVDTGGSKVADRRHKAYGETRYSYRTTSTSYRFTGSSGSIA